MDDTSLLTMDMDECPECDAVIYNGMCTGCKYYKGFELYKGLRCIKCSYLADVNRPKNTEEQ